MYANPDNADSGSARAILSRNERLRRSESESDDRYHQPPHHVTDTLPLQKLMTRASRTEIRLGYWTSRSYHNRQYPDSAEFLALQKFFDHLGAKMLNSKELARVLNANTHPRLFSSWLIMSPNATLLAYSGKPDIQRIRDQATLLSQIWKEQKDRVKERDRAATVTDQYSSSASTTVSTVAEGALETLTIENANSNIIVRAVQPRLLLVLIGGPPPRRKSDFFKITAEAKGDPRYPEAQNDDTGNDEVLGEVAADAYEEAIIDVAHQGTEHSELSEKEKTRILDIQRKKMDAATEFIQGDLTSRSFVMPDEGSIP